MNPFYITEFAGLEDVVSMELATKARLDTREVLKTRGVSLSLVKTAQPKLLVELRTAEDVFALLGRVTLSGGPDDLKLLGKVPAFGQHLTQAIGVRAGLARRPVAGRVRYRVVVQARDASWREYRRVDMQAAAEAAIHRSHPVWRIAPDAPVEIWLTQAGRELIIGLRLTESTHRQRGGRASERAAALRPTIAASMVYLSEPEDDDVFMDPMCGSGTILLERALAGRYQKLLGGDSDGAAVAATLDNFGPRHQPRRIDRWDATDLPLDDRSVDKIVSNLPWGKQIGDVGQLPELYRALIVEWARVLAVGGRMVLMTADGGILRQAAEGVRGIEIVRTLGGVEVLGQMAEITVFERTGRAKA